jgi:hypothetical protein
MVCIPGRIIEVELVRAEEATPPFFGGCSMDTSFVIAIAIVFVWIFLSGEVGKIAEKRGHSGILWCMFSSICSPLIGFLVVQFLPSAADVTPVEYTWCRYCLRTVKGRTDICPYCHADLIGRSKAEKRAA